MSGGRLVTGVVACLVGVVASGCASIDELRQSQAALRNVEAQKAEVEQELFDSRSMVGTLRTRADSMEDQLAVTDQLINNLTRENDGLEQKFRMAQSVLEKVADRSSGAVVVGRGQLPADLDAALRQFASQNPSSVVYDAEHGALRWTSDMVFAFASDVVKETTKDSLRALSGIMKTPAAKGFDLVVVGHTDDIPIRRPETLQKHPTNRHLSVHRAIAVANELQRAGIAASRLGVMGFGEYRPIAPNDSDANRAMNRRVEMYMVPSGMFATGAEAAAAMTFTGDAASTTK